jgi:hypothetical protein
MRVVTPATIEERLSFARKAADHFATHPQHHTYTVNGQAGIVPEALFAVRCGVAPEKPNAVLVFRIADEEVVVYGDMDYDREGRLARPITPELDELVAAATEAREFVARQAEAGTLRFPCAGWTPGRLQRAIAQAQKVGGRA